MKRLLTIVALCLTVALPLGSRAEAGATPCFDEIIVFGASMSDTGNAYILSGGAFGGPPNFVGRFCNGPVWVEQLAETLGLGTPTEAAPFPAPSEAGGTNYAVGGADSSDRISRQGAPGMGVQIDYFFQDGRTLDGDELIVVQGGGNDESAVVAASNVVRHIARLADAGGKHFLVNNHFRASQAPAAEHGDPGVDQYVAMYGALLSAGLDLIEASYDVTIYRFDMVGLTDDMIADPSDYGLTNITDPLRLDPDGEPGEYMWWDPHHFTTKVHGFFADAAASLIFD